MSRPGFGIRLGRRARTTARFWILPRKPKRRRELAAPEGGTVGRVSRRVGRVAVRVI